MKGGGIVSQLNFLSETASDFNTTCQKDFDTSQVKGLTNPFHFW